MSEPLLPFEIEIVPDDDTLTARAGLPVVVEVGRAVGLRESVTRHVQVRLRRSGLSEADKVEDLVVLLADGGDCLDDIAALRADAGFQRLLGRRLGSPDAYRRFLYAFHDERLVLEAQRGRSPEQKAYIVAENAPLRGLHLVNVDLVGRVAQLRPCTTATLDHDATIQESHKREAQPHYQGGRGYQPSVIYWAEQDLALADEYRDGNVPAGMGNLPLIQRGFAALPETAKERYFRADSACYEEKVLKWLADDARTTGRPGKIGFTISADMTEALRRVCAAVGSEGWTLVEDRVDETVACADVEFTPGDWSKDAWPLRYVAVRIQKKQGQLFAGGFDTMYLAVVSNRWELGGPELLRWHWQKAGTIEHVHDVMKNELGAAVPPCGRLGANAAWYRLSLITYNVLSAAKSLVLPPSLQTARPKRLRRAVFAIAGRIVRHAGRLVVRIGHSAEQLAGLIAARERLLRLHTLWSTA